MAAFDASAVRQDSAKRPICKLVRFNPHVLYLQEVGYNFAQPYFQGIVQTEKVKAVFRSPVPISPHLSDAKLGYEHTNSSMTDLADIMSKESRAPFNPLAFNITDALSE